MFGYITPFKPEMRVREWNLYKAYYCGLCHEIRREYGQLPRLALNYDLVTIAILADALSGESPDMQALRCVASPHKKKCSCKQTNGLKLAAACLIIATYYKLSDDTCDESGAKRLAAKSALNALKKAHNKAKQFYPETDIYLKSQMAAQLKLEGEKCDSPDIAAEPTAKMTSAMFSLCSESGSDKKILSRLGYMIGKIIYYLDAAEDHAEDTEKGKYNIFAEQTGQNAAESAAALCRLCAGDAALSYNLLILKSHREILDNIIYLGIEQSILNAGKKKKHTDS